MASANPDRMFGIMRRSRAVGGAGTPMVVLPPALIAIMLLALPTIALIVRVPWSSLGTVYRTQHVWTAIRLSIESSLEATAIALVLGVPLAWLLARVRAFGMGLVRAAVTIPLVLPPVIGGVALFDAIGRNGILGDWIDAIFGTSLPFTYPSIVLAQTFVSMPFLVITVESAFRLVDSGIEEAAATLGASRTRIFARVTLPLVLPAVLAGAVLCWARALGEFGATLLIGGNTTGRTQTVPTLVLTVFQTDPADAPALGLPLIAVALIVLGALRDKWLRPIVGS